MAYMCTSSSYYITSLQQNEFIKVRTKKLETVVFLIVKEILLIRNMTWKEWMTLQNNKYRVMLKLRIQDKIKNRWSWAMSLNISNHWSRKSGENKPGIFDLSTWISTTISSFMGWCYILIWPSQAFFWLISTADNNGREYLKYVPSTSADEDSSIHQPN